MIINHFYKNTKKITYVQNISYQLDHIQNNMFEKIK